MNNYQDEFTNMQEPYENNVGQAFLEPEFTGESPQACFPEPADTNSALTDGQQRSPESLVTFNAHGGTLPPGTHNPRWVWNGTAIGTLPIPIRPGFEFVGWWNGNTQIHANTVIWHNITIIASWWTAASITNGHLMHQRVVQQPQSLGHNVGNGDRAFANIDRITVHHSVSTSHTPSIQEVNNWWAGNALYHFLIRGDGSIWQLRPIGARLRTTLSTNANDRSIHIAFAGTFSTATLPTLAARNSFSTLCRAILGHAQLPNITLITHAVGHGDWEPNICPGFSTAQFRSWI